VSGRAKLARAKKIDKALRSVPKNWRTYSKLMGKLAYEMQQGDLYRLLGYKTFENYVDSLDAARGLVFEMKKVYQSFKSLPEQRWFDVPNENLKMMVNLPERQRLSERWLAEARRRKAPEFRALLNSERGLALEETARITIKTERSAEGPIRDALAAARLIYGLTTDGDALEAIAEYFMQGPCEEQEGQSNQEAYQGLRRKR